MFSKSFRNKFSCIVLLLAFSSSYSSSSFANKVGGGKADLSSWMSATVTWNYSLPITATQSGSFFADGFAFGNASYYTTGTDWIYTDTVDLVNNIETVFAEAKLVLHAQATIPGYAEAWGNSQGSLFINACATCSYEVFLEGHTLLSASADNPGLSASAYLSLAQITMDDIQLFTVVNPPTPTYDTGVYAKPGTSNQYEVGGSQTLFLRGPHSFHLDPYNGQVHVPEPRILSLLGISIMGMLFMRARSLVGQNN